MAEVKRKFFEQTKVIWQPHVHHPLTDEDARQIIKNAIGFFDVLREWEKREEDKNSS